MPTRHERVTPRQFTGAFACFKGEPCPQSTPHQNGDHGCPAWWTQEEVHSGTGETRITEGCGATVLKGVADLLIDKTMVQNAILDQVAEGAINRIGVIFANNMHKIPLDGLANALKAKMLEHKDG